MEEQSTRFLKLKEGGQETADEEMSFIEKSIGAVPTYFINENILFKVGKSLKPLCHS